MAAGMAAGRALEDTRERGVLLSFLDGRLCAVCAEADQTSDLQWILKYQELNQLSFTSISFYSLISCFVLLLEACYYQFFVKSKSHAKSTKRSILP